MPHGTPDYWGAAPKETVYALADMAELAARLGSINTFDRRGDVLFQEDFSEGLGRWYLEYAADGGIVLSTTYWSSAGYSAKMTTGVAAEETLADMRHREPYLTPGGIGAEASFRPFGTITNWYMELSIWTGTSRLYFGLLYDYANTKFQYRNSAGTFVDLATSYSLSSEPRPFWTVKIVGDSLLEEYKRILINNNSYDLTGIACQVNLASLPACTQIWIELEGREGYNDVCYVDDVILTQNEP